MYDKQARERIAQQVHDRRKERNMTLPQLAEAIGSSTNTIGNMERGISWPQKHNLEALADYLGIQLEEPDEDQGEADEEVPAFPPDVEAVRDMLGLYLERFEPGERTRRIRAITRAILAQKL